MGHEELMDPLCIIIVVALSCTADWHANTLTCYLRLILTSFGNILFHNAACQHWQLEMLLSGRSALACCIRKENNNESVGFVAIWTEEANKPKFTTQYVKTLLRVSTGELKMTKSLQAKVVFVCDSWSPWILPPLLPQWIHVMHTCTDSRVRVRQLS